MDANDDLAIDKKEFKCFDTKEDGSLFDKIDSNRDNSVTELEILAYFNGVKKARGAVEIHRYVAWGKKKLAARLLAEFKASQQ